MRQSKCRKIDDHTIDNLAHFTITKFNSFTLEMSSQNQLHQHSASHSETLSAWLCQQILFHALSVHFSIPNFVVRCIKCPNAVQGSTMVMWHFFELTFAVLTFFSQLFSLGQNETRLLFYSCFSCCINQPPLFILDSKFPHSQAMLLCNVSFCAYSSDLLNVEFTVNCQVKIILSNYSFRMFVFRRLTFCAFNFFFSSYLLTSPGVPLSNRSFLFLHTPNEFLLVSHCQFPQCSLLCSTRHSVLK